MCNISPGGDESLVAHSNPFVGFDDLRKRARLNGESLIALRRAMAAGPDLRIPEEDEIYDIPAIIVLIQAINHGADHRSQIATIVGQYGIEFPELSGWRYFDALSEGGDGVVGTDICKYSHLTSIG